MRSFLIFITRERVSSHSGGAEGKPVPFLLYVPSGRLSGPILKPERCFFGFEESASSSRGLLGAMMGLEVLSVF
jgi:hypothetical protein